MANWLHVLGAFASVFDSAQARGGACRRVQARGTTGRGALKIQTSGLVWSGLVWLSIGDVQSGARYFQTN